MKIYLKQMPPEDQDGLLYFDFSGEAKENGLNIDGGRNFESFFSDEYEQAERAFDAFFIDFEAYGYKICDFCNAELKKKNGKRFSKSEAGKIFRLFESGKDFSEIAAEVLTITQGEEYREAELRGCCQGDLAKAIFPAKMENVLEYAEACYFNTGTEYAIREAEDGEEVTPENFCGGDIYHEYFPEWRDDNIKEIVASNYIGVSPEDIVIFNICGSRREYTYKTV